MVDYASMEKALEALKDGLALLSPERCKSYFRQELENHRRGTIQAFEVAFEMSRNTLVRYLQENGVIESKLLPKTLFRVAFESRLLDDPERWFDYNRARNLTSHSYDAKVADRVLATARDFMPDARALLGKMRDG